MGTKDTHLSTKAFASRSGLTVNQVTRMLRQKKIKGHKRSGRWMIPEGELPTGGLAAPPVESKPLSRAQSASQTQAGAHYSVTEFSAMTYLTEAGVIRWLKQGRLQGTRSPGGEWQISAANLELPTLKHLLRP
ncbi:MAG: hypothetical protein PVJ53_17615 [Desulfobacterales bacterium]|jgi:hypothetical protein